LIERALAGDPASVRALVNRLSPVIARRVAATLWRRCGRINVAQEVTDMSQEVFLSLFQSDGKALRAWDPARGMALDSFVGLLAHHQVTSLLRNRKTAPRRADPTRDNELERFAARDASPESIVASREDLRALLDRLRETLSPRGLELFHRIMVDQESIERLTATTGLTAVALYQWKRRLKRAVQTLGADGAAPV
jgi:RNA polymerase sigma-70 factor (ECF subfamily)